ncbi:INO80 complex subunit C [Cryptococcus deuterogattii 99/473]|uniref:Unplaced genomic scaffold supercont1.7, whole genome shotgun sequence n=1 Tax=Cryptococcus deuterogattii Ram5 TaxID=1296110 RepID=A0A0D0UZG2_9TREE|nr:INO80 complex subunit C [Cryptococcus deuterogattii LA55]KIR40621.1 INO80 complex subunit C [Cryptococcus deuterogattii Ram5]KIR74302.1 INO80 complex subunit C [Cryptococcus deuterogattii CA1014]KIR94211.1 INO80 complex subunit C [Cryptococcus deuterogattii CBS 10090]KIS01218.1 INO80 complex subunit C [Cryptococcus deuterogattii 2001/935-1]KIY55272.1 INO80 complex subunit C [Cryptococcus deuterogattii 99/473]
MPSKPQKNVPRKSNTGTPVASEDGVSIAAVIDRLSYADAPRPFKSASFVSHLPSRTATSSSTSVRKNAKQILALERERYLGGDGFLSAQHVAMRKRGEKIELGKKKKGVAKKGNIQNLLKGKMKRDAEETPGTQEQTPAESRMTSEGTTPTLEEDEDMDMDQKERPAVQAPPGDSEDGRPKKEIVTSPPSLLPPKKYCDITGLHASYTDPRTKLRYKGLDVWHVVRALGPGGDQAYLSLRGAQTSLK